MIQYRISTRHVFYVRYFDLVFFDLEMNKDLNATGSMSKSVVLE